MQGGFQKFGELYFCGQPTSCLKLRIFVNTPVLISCSLKSIVFTYMLPCVYVSNEVDNMLCDVTGGCVEMTLNPYMTHYMYSG